jgi:NAD(P)-dependent dehydrogenase (short-subunit alcohol dehydrogenase family)
MDLALKGKRVLMTGGTKSIGRAIVDSFVAEGAVVGFYARDAKLVKEREKDWQSKQARITGTNFIVDGTITTRVQY